MKPALCGLTLNPWFYFLGAHNLQWGDPQVCCWRHSKIVGALSSLVHFHLPLPPLRAQIPKGPSPGLLAPVLAMPHPLMWPSSGQAPESHSDWQWPAANYPAQASVPSELQQRGAVLG